MSRPAGDAVAHSIQARLKNAAAFGHRTFARRSTLLPSDDLVGLSDSFAEDPRHSGRWRAFLDKSSLEVPGIDFLDVVTSIREFAMPVLTAVRVGEFFSRSWEPGGPWR